MDAGGLAGEGARIVLDCARQLDTVLAVIDIDRDDALPEDILNLVEQRQAARKARDFGRADDIRAALKAQGWSLEDTPSGPRIKRG